MSALTHLLHGAIDLHVHSSPSPMPRRLTHVEAARQAETAGFRAIVVKCHFHNTVMDLIAAAPLLEGLAVRAYGGVALNSSVGGLNPHAVDLALSMGGKVIWFPTISSDAHVARAAEDGVAASHFRPAGIRAAELVSVFGDDGDLRAEVHEILRMAIEADAIVSTGHLGPESAEAVAAAAAAAGGRKVIMSHPNFVSGVDRETVARMARNGVYVEHEIAMYDDDKFFPLDVLLDWIDLVGPAQTVLSSDLGQPTGKYPVDGYRSLLPRLLDAGVSERDVRMMIADNPARLLGLDR